MVVNDIIFGFFFYSLYHYIKIYFFIRWLSMLIWIKLSLDFDFFFLRMLHFCLKRVSLCISWFNRFLLSLNFYSNKVMVKWKVISLLYWLDIITPFTVILKKPNRIIPMICLLDTFWSVGSTQTFCTKHCFVYQIWQKTHNSKWNLFNNHIACDPAIARFKLEWRLINMN